MFPLLIDDDVCVCVPTVTFKGMWPQIVQESSGSQGNNHVLKPSLSINIVDQGIICVYVWAK